jgi:hypothetical protein
MRGILLSVVRACAAAAAAAALLAATPARADDVATCIAASSQGQNFRNAHRLVEAREQLRLCARIECPAVIQSDCSNWLAEVEKGLPTVVVSAKTPAGVDLFDVTVTVDSMPLTRKLDGQSVPMNPGPHAFHFELPDGTKVDRRVLVREGEKNQAVAVVLAPAAGAAGAAAPATPPFKEASAEGSSTWKTLGWIAAGVGVVGIGVGSAFGIAAVVDKNNANCDSNHTCDAGLLSSAHSAAAASDVGFIAGGILLAGGLALVLLSPSGGHEATASLRVAPSAGPGSAGAVMGGAW